MTPEEESQRTPLGRELPLVALAAIALAAVHSWPLVLRLGDVLPAVELGDPYLFAWQMAWEGHALATSAEVLDANMFWGIPNSFAFLDAWHGYAPAGLIGGGADAAIVRYNLVYLFAYTLAFVGPYLLARELRLGRAAALLAAAAYAYAPWRIDQNTHLNILSSGGVALSLFMLVRGYKRGNPWWIFGGWATATWQLSQGFSLGLQFTYLLGVLGLIAIVAYARKKTPRLSRAALVATALGALLFGAWAIAQAVPYLEVVEKFPQARRGPEEVRFYSPPAKGLLAAAENNVVWGGATEGARAGLPWPSEQTLFPGASVLILGAVGLVYRGWSPVARIALAIAAVGTGILSLGYGAPGVWRLYDLLYKAAPGWDAIRTPGRLMTLATLFLALLAGAGLQHLARRPQGDKAAARRRRARPLVIAGTAVGLVLLEGAAVIPLDAPPPVPRAQIEARDPILHLPSDDIHDRVYTFWSTEGLPRVFNGVAAFGPSPVDATRNAAAGFPDQASIEHLRSLGARTVLVHLDRMPDGRAWFETARAEAEGMGLAPRLVENVAVFDVSAD